MRKSLLIIAIFSSIFIIDLAWAQDTQPFGKGFFESPHTFFHPDGEGFVFLLFIIGIALYSLFVWYFYRFISKRDLLPKFFYPKSSGKNVTKVRLASSIVSYAVAFPSIIFVWFIVLAFFVFLIAEEMPFEIAIFVSMAIIGVVRILSYYREDASKEIAKMIPYAILSFFLTSAAVYSDPSFFNKQEIGVIPTHFVENIEGIMAAILLVTVFEFSFRFAFIIKRKFLPVSDEKLEEEIESEVESIAKTHFKKLEDKEKELAKKLEEDFNELKKLKEEQKILSDQLKEKHE